MGGKTAWGLLLGLVFSGCDGVMGTRAEEAAALVESSFAPVQGRVGVEVLGKGVWYRAPSLDGGCLQRKEQAFNSDPRKDRDGSGRTVSRISPTYDAQRFFVHGTESGYCVLVGTGLEMTVLQSNRIDDLYLVDVEFSMTQPAGWGDCLQADVMRRSFEVVEDESGQLMIQDGPVDIGQGACPVPLPLGESRKPSARPRKRAPALPSQEEVLQLLRSFDQALTERDYVQALSLVSCFNLYEESKYGSCSTAELVSLGPIPRAGVDRLEMPWNDNVFLDYDALGRMSRDRQDKAMVHISIDPRRGDASRSLALHHVDGEWKLVGVVGARAEGLTSMRFIYDLDRREKRDIFERRMAGEPIDEKGHPLDPFAEEQEEAAAQEISF